MLLGFDIGGTKSAVTLGRKLNDGSIDITGKTALATSKPVYEMIETLFVAAERLLQEQKVNKDELTGIGISCGGPLSSKKGIILSPPNLPGWDNIPIVELVENRFGKKALLQNDANACAVAEWKYGAGRGYSNVIFLTFGTGMGAGLILDGKLYSGTTDLAGEVGHLRLAEMGPVGFGKAGSFEGFCSGGGIAQLAQTNAIQEIQMGRKVSFCNNLDDLPKITAKAVAEAAYNGDAVALEVYKICAFYLGRGLALLIDILNPEIIILGSIYGRSTDLIEPYMQEVLKAEAIGDALQCCKIVPAGLGEQIGDYAALSLAGMISAQ
ncbi:MAG: ROK family protein [Agriterribacter sp.]